MLSCESEAELSECVESLTSTIFLYTCFTTVLGVPATTSDTFPSSLDVGAPNLALLLLALLSFYYKNGSLLESMIPVVHETDFPDI